jgi:hypothetical protein
MNAPEPKGFRKLFLRFRYSVKVFLDRVPPHRHATVYPDDTFIVSYPKSGNTWMRFLVGNLVYPDNPLTLADVEQRLGDVDLASDGKLCRIPRPRYLKSHQLFHPEYQQVIYIVRDPRDVAVSYYFHLLKANKLAPGLDVNSFVPYFIAEQLYLNFAPWADHVTSWLAIGPTRRKFLFLRYEDLLENTLREVSKVASFLNIDAEKESLERAVELSNADRMRKLEKEQWKQWGVTKRGRTDIPFIRAAKTGQWREALSPASVAAIEGAWGPIMRLLGYKLANDPKRLASTSDTWAAWEALASALPAHQRSQESALKLNEVI